MANPEELFWEGLLMEPAPPSPSVFINIPLRPLGDGDGGDPSLDDQGLLYISRMLMEDDIDDKLSYRYSDHPALHQVQQPFIQILSTPTFGSNNGSIETTGSAASSLVCGYSGNTEDLLPVGGGDQSAANLTFFRGADMEAMQAFLNGMEEASTFLPRENSFRREEVMDQMCRVSSNGRGRKNSYDKNKQLEEEVGRIKKVAAVIREPREVMAREMLDELLLHGHETCIEDMKRLRIDMCNEAENQNRKGSRKTASKVMVDLRMLLIHCAQAVATDNHLGAGELLKQIKQHASSEGDAVQRLAHYFAKGLETRVGGCQLYQPRVSRGIPSMEFLKVHKLFMAACCFNKVAHMFSTMKVMETMRAVAGKNKLHIVGYGMGCGLQWPGLLRCLASRKGGPPEVKITIIDVPQPGFRPAEQIEEVGRELSSCAHKFGLTFKFQAIAAAKWEVVRAENLNIDAGEVLVVNELFSFSTLMDESIFFDSPNPRDVVLNNIRKMQPDVFIQGIVNCSYGTTFLSRFRGVLFYYTALFDMLDATIPRESELRLKLEQDILGQFAHNGIACEGADLLEFPENYRQWQVRNQRAGLRQLPLTPDIVNAVRDEVSEHHHKDFLIGEDGGWLLQGWMGRILFAHSTWVPQEASSE